MHKLMQITINTNTKRRKNKKHSEYEVVIKKIEIE